MAEMRLLEKLRAQILNDYEYTWDTTYNHLLVKNDFNSLTRVTSSETIATGAENVTVTTTKKFFYPFRYRYNTVLDGVARGSVHTKTTMSIFSNAGWAAYLDLDIDIYLKAVKSSGATRTLGSTSTKTVTLSGFVGSLSLETEIPFFIELDNSVISPDEKLLLHIDFKTRWHRDDPSVPVSSTGGTYYTNLNTDDLFIEIPIVP